MGVLGTHIHVALLRKPSKVLKLKVIILQRSKRTGKRPCLQGQWARGGDLERVSHPCWPRKWLIQKEHLSTFGIVITWKFIVIMPETNAVKLMHKKKILKGNAGLLALRKTYSRQL